MLVVSDPHTHRSLDVQPPDPAMTTHATAKRIRRGDLLGGLIHEYERAAA
jgi:hypothetical protein